MTFEDYHFKPFIQRALEKLGFQKSTPIQEAVIPLIKEGKSVVAQSRTGSGKTHSFLLPLMDRMAYGQGTQLVITAPSRELADQLFQAARQIAAQSKQALRIERAYGGTDSKRQLEHLSKYQPEIVIGTPGRLLALVKAQAIDIHKVKAFVVDEADMTLDMGFLATVDQIAGRMPEDLQMAVFSATIPDKLRPFLKKYLQSPEWVKIDNKALISPSIRNILFPLRGRNKDQLLLEILTVGHPYLVLIFANTIDKVEHLYQLLKKEGLAVAKIHGDLPSRERRRVMRQIQNLEYQYVVATDLAARGIDIEGVSHVVNYEIPKELEFFIHRVGRTGRKGQKGIAITFYHPDQQAAIEWLEKRGIQFESMDLKRGEWVKVTDHKERQLRRDRHKEDVDHVVKGMVNRSKKQQVKPGYKQKLKRNIKEYKHKKYNQKQRQKARDQRKANKEKFK